MVKVADIARIKGRKITSLSMEQRAYAIWNEMVSEAKRRGLPVERVGQFGEGYVFHETNIMHFARKVWPDSLDPSKPQRNLIGPLYPLLRATGNVVTLTKGYAQGMGPSKNTIFVRSTYNENKVIPVRPSGKAKAAARREAKVTPEEAGETRTPAPVESRYINGEAESRAEALKVLQDTVSQVLRLEHELQLANMQLESKSESSDTTASEVLALVRETVERASKGDISNTRALADIEDALSL